MKTPFFTWTRKNPGTFATVCATVAMTCATAACNLFGGIDDPDTKVELMSHARAALNSGDCNTAVSDMLTLNILDDEGYQILGWAYLCQGGATLAKVGKSLFTYSSTTANLTVVGNLANELLPVSGDKVAAIENAISAFSNISPRNANDRRVNLALANISKAAIAIAKASPDTSRVRKSHVATEAACDAVASNCVAGCTGGNLQAADLSVISSSLSQASSILLGSGLGAIADLAAQLGNAVGAAALTRCYVYKNMIPN
jgi:hypothetical protein